MATRPIIQIEVSDENFKKFKASFDDYQAKLKDAPALWDKVNLASQRANNTMTTMLGKVTSVGKAFEGIVGSIAKFGALGALTGGIGGFAIDRLAAGVFNAQRNARGLGVSIGQQSSFRVNMGRYVDPNALLSNVANARNDLSQQWAFRALGIGQSQEANASNFGLSLDLVKQAKAIWDSGPKTQQYAQARGLLNFFSMDDLRRLGNTSGAELNAAANATQQNVGAFGLTGKVAGQWAQLSIQLDRAGTSIETALIKGLAPLAPEFDKLSGAVAGGIESILGSKGFKWAIDEMASGIDEFTGWITGPNFKSDIQTFVADIQSLASSVAAGLKALGIIPSGGGNPPGILPGSPAPPGGGPPASQVPQLDPFGNPLPGTPGWSPTMAFPGNSGTPTPSKAKRGSATQAMTYFMNQGWPRKVAAGLAANFSWESGFNPATFNTDKNGNVAHMGLAQWDSVRRAAILKGAGIDVWKQLDMPHQMAAVQWELTHTEKKAAAAMMGAQDAAQAAVIGDNTYERSGDPWYKQAGRGLTARLFDGTITVRVENPAGANVHVSGAQVGYK